MFGLIPTKRSYDVPDVFREMEDLFKGVWTRSPFETVLTKAEDVLIPRIDLAETKEEIIVKADLPGLEAKDLDISVDNDQLVIKGEKRAEKEESGKHYHWIERSCGSFYRAIRLPVEVNKEKIEATFKNGVLNIVLPKAEEAKKSITHVEVH